MTAEIALLNRRALAFASDSAVTISDGTNNKIYNSAEKIFEISHCMPVGLMLYNNMEFMSVPLDVIARNFRRDRRKEHDRIDGLSQDFLEYLGEIPRTRDDEIDHLTGVLTQEFKEIASEHQKRFARAFRDEYEKSKESADPRNVSHQLFLTIVGEHTAVHAKNPLDGFLQDKTVSDFEEAYSRAVEVAASEKLAPVFGKKVSQTLAEEPAVKAALMELSFAAVRSDIFSDLLTGLVFGGFCTKDLFPSLQYMEIDGVYFDSIKTNRPTLIDIDRRGKRAEIVPFAQREMVERFLYGIDEEMQESTINFIKKTAKQVAKKVKEDTGLDLTSSDLNADTYSLSIERHLEKLKEKSRNETLDMVDFMPKQELAYAAEAFVSLTSMKRKVSAQQETVGGPVDVAVITRNEGFVWIKRKHYFSAELNPWYRVRTFKGQDGGLAYDGTSKADS